MVFKLTKSDLKVTSLLRYNDNKAKNYSKLELFDNIFEVIICTLRQNMKDKSSLI